MIKTTSESPTIIIEVVYPTLEFEGLELPPTEAKARVTKCEFYQIEDEKEKLCQDEY